mmetsp:Transcript_56597/g.157690  ORF Transcript_56597/g.157690 Transcript_56597/m.157690 type:complete len:194 (-) Transcript_56597:83-664(-)
MGAKRPGTEGIAAFEGGSDYEDELPLGPPGGICVPAVAAGAVLFATAFGAAGAALRGPRGVAQLLGQVVGGSLGAFTAATMHKEDHQQDARRFALVLVGAIGAAAVDFVVLPLLADIGIVADAVLTSVGAVAVALLTDPDLVGGLDGVVELCRLSLGIGTARASPLVVPIEEPCVEGIVGVRRGSEMMGKRGL